MLEPDRPDSDQAVFRRWTRLLQLAGSTNCLLNVGYVGDSRRKAARCPKQPVSSSACRSAAEVRTSTHFLDGLLDLLGLPGLLKRVALPEGLAVRQVWVVASLRGSHGLLHPIKCINDAIDLPGQYGIGVFAVFLQPVAHGV